MKVHTAGGRQKKEEGKVNEVPLFFLYYHFFSSFSVHTRHSGVSQSTFTGGRNERETISLGDQLHDALIDDPRSK